MTVTASYATTNDFRDFIANTAYSGSWTADPPVILRLLEACSRRMEQNVGNGSRAWGPHYATRLWDLGVGPLRHNVAVGGYTSAAPSLFAGAVGGYSGGNTVGYGYLSIGATGLVPLDDWLIDDGTQVITAYTTSDHTVVQTLAEGTGADYYLEPYNENPKTLFKIYELTTKLLYAGQQTLALKGTWGWQNVTHASGLTLGAAITTTTATTFTASGGIGLAPGNTAVIDTEQMYLIKVNGTTVTVVRGVNGTTAAPHLISAPISVIDYPSDVVECCLELAAHRWKNHDPGLVDVENTQPQRLQQQHGSRRGYASKEAEILDCALEVYRPRRERGGVFV